MNPTRLIVRTAAAAAAIAAVGLTGACGRPDVTKDRLQQSLVPTFENLYVQQAGILGVAGITPTGIGASADCDRGGPKIADVPTRLSAAIGRIRPAKASTAARCNGVGPATAELGERAAGGGLDQFLMVGLIVC